jgi:hypothetical protein
MGLYTEFRQGDEDPVYLAVKILHHLMGYPEFIVIYGEEVQLEY